MSDADLWLSKIANLRLDRARGDPAPHKPLLLLAILDLAEQGDLPADVLPLSPELAFRFLAYWTVVAARRTARPDVRLPFHHLQSDSLWMSCDETGRPSPDRRLTRYARLSPSFSDFARDPTCRDRARRVLITQYFQPSERIALGEMLGISVPAAERTAENGSAYASSGEARQAGREARFRLIVMGAYEYACALTGCRLTTITGGSVVDAAHIHEFSNSRNNEISNGLALCRNAHWSFDNGLWTVADDCRVIVAVGRFTEENPDGRRLMEYHGQRLRLPKDRNMWPSPVHLAWHRRNRFLGS
jgi:putative restriction endonuclease